MDTIVEQNYATNPIVNDNFSISSKENDFWNDLPKFVQKGILESQEQFKQGKFTKFSEVKESILNRNI
jgi:hypothetical protein